jgi:hypothetical protein
MQTERFAAAIALGLIVPRFGILDRQF